MDLKVKHTLMRAKIDTVSPKDLPFLNIKFYPTIRTIAEKISALPHIGSRKGFFFLDISYGLFLNAKNAYIFRSHCIIAAIIIL